MTNNFLQRSQLTVNNYFSVCERSTQNHLSVFTQISATAISLASLDSILFLFSFFLCCSLRPCFVFHNFFDFSLKIDGDETLHRTHRLIIIISSRMGCLGYYFIVIIIAVVAANGPGSECVMVLTGKHGTFFCFSFASWQHAHHKLFSRHPHRYAQYLSLSSSQANDERRCFFFFFGSLVTIHKYETLKLLCTIEFGFVHTNKPPSTRNCLARLFSSSFCFVAIHIHYYYYYYSLFEWLNWMAKRLMLHEISAFQVVVMYKLDSELNST